MVRPRLRGGLRARLDLRLPAGRLAVRRHRGDLGGHRAAPLGLAAGPMTRTQVIDDLAARTAAVRLPHPLRVAIDGRTGSGKTTLADELAACLSARRRPIIRTSIDGFH